MRLRWAKRGVIGIHFDEVHNVFSASRTANGMILDSSKSLVKEEDWPMMLILSGVPVLANHVNEEE
jgi:hypothetical protein